MVLLTVPTGKCALRSGATSQVELFLGLSRIIVRDLFDFLELLHQALLANMDSRLVHPTMQQRYKCQRENAVKGMDAEHLVRPVAGRGKADEVRVLHVSEGPLDVMLAAVAQYDFFIRKILAIRKQYPLAENTLLEFMVGGIIGSKFNTKPSAFASDLSPKKIRDILAGDDLIQTLLQTLLGVGFAFPSRFMAAGNAVLKITQGLQLLGEVLPYAAHLSLEQGPASGDNDGALLSKNFFLRTMNPNAFEKRVFDVTKPFQRNVQKILVLGRDQRANEMVRRTVQGLNCLLYTSDAADE